MFALHKDSISAQISGPLFHTDLSSVLTLFVGVSLPTETVTQHNKLSHSFGSGADACCENTTSESNPELKEDNNHNDRIIFQLNYLPKQILEEEVLEKLVRFGKVHHFSLLQSSLVEPKKTCEKKVGNFRSADFSFEGKDAEQIFLTVKRIRIRGLQVKISQKESLKESVEEKANSPINKGEELPQLQQVSALSAEDQIHLELPTSKKYFSGRSSQVSVDSDQTQSQYYFWRRRTPLS